MTDIVPVPNWGGVRQLETNEYATGGLNGNMNEQAKALAGQNMYSRLYAGLPFDPVFTAQVGGFPIGGKAALENGDIVRSTVANNTNDPNTDMTVWVKTNDASQIFDGSQTQKELNNHFKATTKILTPDMFGNVASDATTAILLCRDAAQTIIANGGLAEIQLQGDYTLAQSLILTKGMRLNTQNGSRLLAKSGFSGDSLVLVKGTSSELAEVEIFGHGVISCQENTDAGIRFENARYSRVSDIKINGSNQFGIILGLQEDSVSSYELNINGVSATNAMKANSAESIGIYHGKSTDCYVTDTNVVGYRTGYKSNSGPIYYTNAHTWCNSIHAAMKCGFDVRGSASHLINCFADTPFDLSGNIGDLYGFNLYGYWIQMHACSVFMNTSLGGGTEIRTDNRIIPVNFERDIFGTINGLNISGGSSEFRFKAPLGGSYTNTNIHDIIIQNTDIFASIANLNANRTRQKSLHKDTIIRTGSGGTDRDIALATNEQNRWEIAANSDSELGNSSGSNFVLRSVSDTGNKKEVLRVERSTGEISIWNVPFVTRGTYDIPTRINNVRVWRDDVAGFLRVKNGVPANNTDGAIIGQRVAVPATSTSNGLQGQYAADESYFYIYVGNNTSHLWKKVALTTM